MSKLVNFRLPENLHKELSRRARTEGSSVGIYARKLLAEALDKDPTSSEALSLEVQDLQRNLKQVRLDLFHHLVGTLHFVAKMPAKEAYDVAKKTVLRERD